MLATSRQLDWTGDPRSVLRRWPAERAVALLHSGRFDPRWARWSVLAEPTEAVRCVLDAGDHARCRRRGPGGEVREAGTDPWAVVAELEADADAAWLGYFAYDMGRCVEALPRRAADDRGWPAMQWQRCPGWAVHDAVSGAWRAGGAWASDPPRLAEGGAGAAGFAAGPLLPGVPDESYRRAVARVIDFIAAGDVFQVNLARRLTAAFTGSARGFYDALASASPAWYGALVELLPFDPAEPRRTLASTSPELFLSLDRHERELRVTTRPIKGTRPAHAPGDELENSGKDAAELAMIVDLLRNDLGRIARFGSVRVDEPRTIEHHPTVQHATATVAASLDAGRGLRDLLRASLPGGSITGAPKVRAMEIIDEIEPFRRGPYCGAIGWIHGGSARLNIAIRTAALEQPPDGPGRLDAWVGAGIVADSDPAAELDETRVKAEAIRRALSAPDA